MTLFQTGDASATGVPSDIKITIDSVVWLKSAFVEAFRLLTNESNWTPQDTVSAEDAAAMASEALSTIIFDYEPEECPDVTERILGMVFSTMQTGVPDGCLLCDGTTYLRTAYPELYAITASAFIVDADNFKVPDLRGRFVLGAGQGLFSAFNRLVGSAGGIEDVTLTTNQIPAHHHNQMRMNSASGALSGWTTAVDTSSSAPTDTGSDTSDTGGGASHSNMPPYLPLQHYVVAVP